MKSAGSVDKHLGDQLLIPAALLAAERLGSAKPGTTSYTTEAVTAHLETNAEVLKRFLPVEIEIRPSGEVHVKPRTQT
jgi:RNA 3'-terminal phosphate cyclase (ATP)